MITARPGLFQGISEKIRVLLTLIAVDNRKDTASFEARAAPLTFPCSYATLDFLTHDAAPAQKMDGQNLTARPPRPTSGSTRNKGGHLPSSLHLCEVPITVVESSEAYFATAVEDSLGEYGDDVESVIERSKSHWTQVDTSDAWTDSEEDLEAENGKFFQGLKEDIPSDSRQKKGFFQDYGESLKVGRKIGEGGQAEIFEGTWMRNEVATEVVVKLFKHGYKLADLQRLWPRGMFHSDFASDFVCGVLGATLLDGRLAFVMSRCWGDLRRVIDLRMRKRKHGPPFEFQEARKIMSNIAHGMDALHAHGILHRDLKASNVLLSLNAWTGDPFDKDYDVCSDEREIGDELYLIADFESSENILGTGFWRAPEVLRAVEKVSLDSIWTEKIDAYSFGMTCYEILTGHVPFDHIKGLKSTDYGIVLEGGRPPLPDYIPAWIREVVQKCWHPEPSKRPSFNEILGLLHSTQDFEEKWKVTRRFGWF